MVKLGLLSVLEKHTRYLLCMDLLTYEPIWPPFSEPLSCLKTQHCVWFLNNEFVKCGTHASHEHRPWGQLLGW